MPPYPWTEIRLTQAAAAAAEHGCASAVDVESLVAEVRRLRAVLEDIKLRYDDEGKFAARDMWRVAYEALE